MKFPLLKLRKNPEPKLSDLRKPLFRTELFWYLALALSVLVLAVISFIGFKFFYYGYFEEYKKGAEGEFFENPFDVVALRSVVEKRTAFINSTTTLPIDPSR